MRNNRSNNIEPRSGDFFVDSDLFVEKEFIKSGRDVVLISIEGERERGRNRRLEIAAPVCLFRRLRIEKSSDHTKLSHVVVISL